MLVSWLWGIPTTVAYPYELSMSKSVVAIGIWDVFFVALLGYLVATRALRIGGQFRRPSIGIAAACFVMAAPVSLLHAPVGVLGSTGLGGTVAWSDAEMRDGLTSALAAFRTASPGFSAVGLLAAIALTASQVAVVIGFGGGAFADDTSAKAWKSVQPGLILATLYGFGATLGFPFSTTIALVAGRAVTGTTVAPMVLAGCVCFFVWL